MASTSQQYGNRNDNSRRVHENQVSQLATSLSKIESQGKLPSQTVVNPKQNASAITLRSGKELLDKNCLLNARTKVCLQFHTTGVILQLADRSIVYPEGILEDVLVQVNELIFPADFYILDMEDDKSSNSSVILLGRPFLRTVRTKIDVYDGTFTMEIDGEVITFNVYDAMKYPNDMSSVYGIDVLEPLSHEIFELSGFDELNTILCKHIDLSSLKKLENFLVTNEILQETVYELEAL
ncbi:hypothetical protein K2173_003752 [Erythroxylum novogranatense]|uniref:Uncharacterized protein n=1 Tax=Erythroxylum novogranatense TaxID=1862640 RepID=A0AAV8TCF5_9ROSI|nr:hypothetical protein K2173_003752 [Erythroxylum novogranatense]